LKDGRVDDSDYDSELWDYDNTDGLDADQLSQDYAEGITLDEVLPTGEGSTVLGILTKLVKINCNEVKF